MIGGWQLWLTVWGISLVAAGVGGWSIRGPGPVLGGIVGPPACPGPQVITVTKTRTTTTDAKTGAVTVSESDTPVVVSAPGPAGVATARRTNWQLGLDWPVARTTTWRETGISAGARIGASPAWVRLGWRPGTGEIAIGAAWEF